MKTREWTQRRRLTRKARLLSMTREREYAPKFFQHSFYTELERKETWRNVQITATDATDQTDKT